MPGAVLGRLRTAHILLYAAGFTQHALSSTPVSYSAHHLPEPTGSCSERLLQGKDYESRAKKDATKKHVKED